MSEFIHVKSISQVHEMLGIDKPRHPLVSLLELDERIINFDYGSHTYVFDFYQISLKAGISGSITYGRNSYDFQEGTILFTRPGQAMSFADSEPEVGGHGWTLLFHPDLIRKSELGHVIDRYSFFSYEAHEALHLSEEEKATLTDLAGKIEKEYRQNIDRHSQKLIISNISLLLDYCTRFYDRQFYVRTNLNQDIVSRFENLLRDYYEGRESEILKLPTVKYCSEALNMSAHYLSDLLKKETGKPAQQHIQDFIVDRAKTLLLGTTDPVSQIAYALGFDYPQHFSKMFKTRTGMSPLAYRRVN